MGKLLTTALALALVCTGSAANARTMTVFSYQPSEIGGKRVHAFVPIQVLAGADGRATAQLIVDRLKSRKSSAYVDVTVTISDASATVTIGKQCPNSGLVLGELFLSLAVHGVTLTHGKRQLGFADLVAPAFVTSYSAWQALAVKSGMLSFVVAGSSIWSLAAFRKRLAARDKAVMSALFAALERGPAVAQVQVLRFLSTQKTVGLAPRLLPLLTPAASSTVKLLVLAALKGQRSKKVVAAVERLVSEDPDPAVKTMAVQVLIAAGIKKYAFILDFKKLQSSSESEVIAAIGRLERAQNPAVVSALLKTLAHASQRVRDAALKAIVAYRQWKPLAAALAQTGIPQATRLAMALALSRQGDAQSKGLGLGFIVRHGTPGQATTACGTIAKAKLISAAPAVALALKRSETGLQQAALTALGALGQVASLGALAQFAAAQPSLNKATTKAAVAILSQQTLATVMGLVKDKALWTRQWAIQSLGTVALKQGSVNADVVKTLLSALKAPETAIRRAAMYALARTKQQSVVHKLIGYAKDRDAELRGQLAVALSGLTSDKSAKALIEMLADENDEVKALAIAGVAKRRLSDSVEQLKRMAGYGAVNVRREVLRALVKLSKPKDASLLSVYSGRLYDDDEQVKLAAIVGLQRITGRQVVAALGGALLDSSSKVKIAALDALAAAQVPEAWQQIVKALADGEVSVRRAALVALGKLKSGAAKRAIQTYLQKEQDAALRKLATQTIAQLP